MDNPELERYVGVFDREVVETFEEDGDDFVIVHLPYSRPSYSVIRDDGDDIEVVGLGNSRQQALDNRADVVGEVDG